MTPAIVELPDRWGDCRSTEPVGRNTPMRRLRRGEAKAYDLAAVARATEAGPLAQMAHARDIEGRSLDGVLRGENATALGCEARGRVYAYAVEETEHAKHGVIAPIG